MSSYLDPDSLKYILGQPKGRKVIWDILAIAGVFRQPFDMDQRRTDFNCGALNIGLALYAECLSTAPDLTAMMTKEQANDHGNNPSPDDNRSSGSDGNRSGDTALGAADDDYGTGSGSDYNRRFLDGLGFDRGGGYGPRD